MSKMMPWLLWGMFACGGEASDGPDTTSNDTFSSDTTDIPDDTLLSDTDVDSTTQLVVPTDLGTSCVMGCNLATCVDTDSACEALCLFDGRDTPSTAYCSMPCIDTCPPGWTCLTPADAEFEGLDTKVCMANEAVCGNTILEHTEACDDGNTDDGDLCAGDCSRETLPTTSGRVTMSLNGGTPFTFEGSKEGGFAQLRSDGTLVWSEVNSMEIFGLSLAGIGERTGLAPNQFAEVEVSPLPCNFRGLASFALTTFDRETRHIAGSFTALMSCQFGCFDCGGDGAERTVSVDFDMTWLDRPDL